MNDQTSSDERPSLKSQRDSGGPVGDGAPDHPACELSAVDFPVTALRVEVRRALNEAFPLAECRGGHTLEKATVDWIVDVLSGDEVACDRIRSMRIDSDDDSERGR